LPKTGRRRAIDTQLFWTHPVFGVFLCELGRFKVPPDVARDAASFVMTHFSIIQVGMGVAISNWRLARAVSQQGNSAGDELTSLARYFDFTRDHFSAADFIRGLLGSPATG
jgi:hypothetical protein